MDFTLSLAHFCELHGPISVMCTQLLGIDCDRCHSPTQDLTPVSDEDQESYFIQQAGRKKSIAPNLAQAGNAERCDSCSMRFPPIARKTQEQDIFVKKDTAMPFRTKQDIQVCGDTHESEDEETDHSTRCHIHNVEYVSSSSPIGADVFVALRNATVRTLSGEQLPKGQRQGPLLFGDPATGFSIAYYFRLADGHARGKERYYALIALLGTEANRAFESCATVWSLLEQVASRIVAEAENVVQRGKPNLEANDSKLITTPVSSFLTQRTLDPDGVPRRGAEAVRANNITELVDNVNFFCELHMMFVKMLQELGKIFGGLKVNPRDNHYRRHSANTGRPGSNSAPAKVMVEDDEDDFRMSPLVAEQETPRFLAQTTAPKFEMPDYTKLTPSPSPKRQAVHG